MPECASYDRANSHAVEGPLNPSLLYIIGVFKGHCQINQVVMKPTRNILVLPSEEPLLLDNRERNTYFVTILSTSFFFQFSRSYVMAMLECTANQCGWKYTRSSRRPCSVFAFVAIDRPYPIYMTVCLILHPNKLKCCRESYL
jgi:hypothetical protein